MDNRNMMMYLVALITSVAVIVYGIFRDNFIVFTMAFSLAVLVSALLVTSRKTPICPKLSLLCVLFVLVSSIAVAEFPYDPGMTISHSGWAHMMGAVYWLMSFPLAALTLQTIAVLADAKYNYPLISGFMVFISGALITVAMVAVSYLNKDEIADLTINSLDLMAALFMNLVLSCIVGIALAIMIKRKRFVLSRESSEVRQ